MQCTHGRRSKSSHHPSTYLFPSWVKLIHTSIFIQDLFTLLLYKFVSRLSSFEVARLVQSGVNERQTLPGYDLFLGWLRAAGFGEYHGWVCSRMLFVVLHPRSFLFISNACSPGVIEYTGFMIIFVGDSLQSLPKLLGCLILFLFEFISFIAWSYFFIIKVILMHISEWNEYTNSLISWTRDSL